MGFALAVATVAPASAAKTPNPCKLLKKSEIGKVTHRDVSDPSRNTTLCGWDLDGGLGGGGSLLVLEIDKGSDAASNYEGFATGQEKVHGLGDRAFYDSVLGMNVLKGNTYLHLSESSSLIGKKAPSKARVRRELTKLAKLASKRI